MDRKHYDTPLFRARCNSMLAFIAFKGRVYDNDLEDGDAVRKLIADQKIRYVNVGNFLMAVPGSQPYNNDGTDPENRPHPLVLDLASENPANETFVKVYRKNLDYCPLTIAA